MEKRVEFTLLLKFVPIGLLVFMLLRPIFVCICISFSIYVYLSQLATTDEFLLPFTAISKWTLLHNC